ncbi:MAG: metal-binding protein [Cyclobacteriaceae bacterium]|nr:metal-binding protein [Cyclobacteriaceae bacterium]
MIRHEDLDREVGFRVMRRKTFSLAGNSRLKIYGSLQCPSGKRMKKTNRVFFMNEEDAIKHGYRPCGSCLKKAYQQWKTARNRLKLCSEN